MNEILNEIDANEVTERDNLAVVYSVERLEAIPGKDRIELVHLTDCGYTTICEKGHSVGDLVVFIKYDTVLPKNELFEFMADYKYRVKSKSFTEKNEAGEVVKKIYSQGIVLPIGVVREFIIKSGTLKLWDDDYESCGECVTIIGAGKPNTPIAEGSDFTEILEIKKYIPPVAGGSGFGEMRTKGSFPTHIISKTDEMNLASKVRALDELQGKAVYITQKIEGSSVSCFLEDNTQELIVCSRNNMITETETCKFWIAANKHNLKDKLIDYPWLAIQAELYGSGIQKNKLGIEGVDIAIFNMVDKRTRQRLGFKQMDFIAQTLGLPLVPVCCIIENFDWTFDQLQEFADIQKYPNGEIAEGIVVRPMEPFISQVLKEEWSFKVIGRDYKL
jgi:RNA ligase (TIGR02306 family)